MGDGEADHVAALHDDGEVAVRRVHVVRVRVRVFRVTVTDTDTYKD